MPAVVPSNNIGALYASHRSWLCDWLHGHTRCPQRAADLAHDTFCRLLEKPEPAPTPLRDARSYLATVARRILIDDIRHREVERVYLAVHIARTGTADDLTPERIVGATHLLAALLRLLETLPDKARAAFLMIRFEGMRYAEAAERLGVSERMVKRYVAQGYMRCYAFAYPD